MRRLDTYTLQVVVEKLKCGLMSLPNKESKDQKVQLGIKLAIMEVEDLMKGGRNK